MPEAPDDQGDDMGRAALIVVAGIALAAPLTALPAQAAAPVARAAAVAATPPATTTPLPFPFLRAGYVQAPITPAQRIGALTRPVAKGDTAPKDSHGARMVRINGRLYYHPVVLADWGTQNLESYRLTGDTFYLTRAEAQANRLIAMRTVRDFAWYYPYTFDFALHSLPTQVQRAPWYSAMSQGMALDLFTRLAQVTNDPAWRAAADHTFESFLLPPKAGVPWVVHTDASHNLWLEEYPRWPWTKSDFTLNGHLFAVFGLDSYARMTNDPRALALWDGGLRTAAVLAPRAFRNPGWYSDYCLAHGAPGAKKHFVHIDEFLHAHAATGSPTFARLADSYALDYPSTSVRGRFYVARGRVTLSTLREGRIVGTRSLAVRASTSVAVDQRLRVRGHGIWFHISTGLLRGQWVQQVPERQYYIGAGPLLRYLIPRTLHLPAGPNRVLRLDPSGFSAWTVRTLSAPGTSKVDRSGVIRGVAAVHVASGPLAGLWVPFGTGRLD